MNLPEATVHWDIVWHAIKAFFLWLAVAIPPVLSTVAAFYSMKAAKESQSSVDELRKARMDDWRPQLEAIYGQVKQAGEGTVLRIKNTVAGQPVGLKLSALEQSSIKFIGENIWSLYIDQHDVELIALRGDQIVINYTDRFGRPFTGFIKVKTENRFEGWRIGEVEGIIEQWCEEDGLMAG